MSNTDYKKFDDKKEEDVALEIEEDYDKHESYDVEVRHDKVDDHDKLIIHKRHHHIDNEITNFRILINVLQSSIPATFGLLFVFITETINIMIVGRHNIPSLIAAIGLGTLYVNATGYIPGAGLLGGIDTLCSQAFGKKDFHRLGIYASIGRVSITLFFVVFCVPLNFASAYLLNFIGIDPEISELASKFCHAMSISVFFALQFNTSLKYLQAMNFYLPGSIITCVTALLHPLWCILLVNTYDLGVVGAGFSMGITQFLNFLFVSIYIHIKNPYPESYFYFTQKTFVLRNIFSYLKKAVPAAIMWAADWIGFEILTFMASFLGSVPLAANVCLFNYITVIFMLQVGISMAATTLVGNSIGQGDKKLAIRYSIASLIVGESIMVCTTLLTYYFRADIPFLYTQEMEVGKLLYALLGIYLLFSIPDSGSVILHGIIKGLGKQKWASVVCLTVLYPINISLAYYLAFHLGYGVLGLWYSQLVSILLLLFSYTFITLRVDFDEVIAETDVIFSKYDSSKSVPKIE